ncbi:MAG TPA: hypothetical protein VNJ02_16355 [Vicinamibacterales bacterium]|nr:hypothetical protein [Vicinamibacterales bacterium]
MIDDINDDIDALITELNASSSSSKASDSLLRVELLLAEVIQRRGSDLLLIAGSAPGIRVDGSVVRLDRPVVEGFDVEEAVVRLLPPHAKRQFQQHGIADASLRVPSLGRFRVNLHRERGRTAAAIRVLPPRVPKLAELGLPVEVAALSSLGRGLVLIGGATGAGKTTNGRVGGRDQPPRCAPHHYCGRSDRIRASARAFVDRAGRNRPGRPRLPHRITSRGASGA